MAMYPTFGADPGWLGSPKYKQPMMGIPQYSNPALANNPQFGGGIGQYTRPIVSGGSGGYANPGVNDPTLAPGYGGMGGAASGGGLPPGAVTPPFQYAGGGIPNYLASQGWRVGRGPNGPIWIPPNTQRPMNPGNLTYF